jgi:hypothetical protein
VSSSALEVELLLLEPQVALEQHFERFVVLMVGVVPLVVSGLEPDR